MLVEQEREYLSSIYAEVLKTKSDFDNRIIDIFVEGMGA
jgi:hypothetical protein